MLSNIHIILFILIIFFTGFIGGLLPLRIKPTEKGKKQMALSNAFAAGIFLGAGVIHLLGHSDEVLRSMDGWNNYPYAYLFALAGFLFIFLISNILFKEQDLETDIVKRPLTPYILILVLSVHSIIAGMALGLETHVQASYAIFIAIISHKGIAAFALGINFRSHEIRVKKIISLIFFFALMTPLGIIIGKVLGDHLSHTSSNLFEGIFDGLAAGTFIYIAIVDIMRDAFKTPGQKILKYFVLIAGVAVMAVIAIWI